MIVENYTSGTGQKLKVHDAAVCSALRVDNKDLWCVIHKRKNTHMLDWPTHWRADWGGFMEVICPHGVGHPAPEETRPGGSGHGCDGCCFQPSSPVHGQGFRYRIGGMLRCCILTLTRAAEEGFGPGVDMIRCGWCQSSLVLRDGAWEWSKDRSWYTPEAKQS